ncbi:MAG: palmitoyltransferase for Vac8p [Geoglossum simile]|nr:MAG: palmitoyltransferase for Vac8p [Geoglossum simile]
MMPVNYVLLAVVSGIIGLVLTGFTGWHLSLILKNQTTIECLEKVRYLSPLRKNLQNQRRYESYPSPDYGQQLRKVHTNALPNSPRGEVGVENALQAGSQSTTAMASLHRSYNDLERERESNRYQSYLEEQLLEKLPNAFDLGWRANLHHMFGPSPWFWCLPVCNSTGDGWNWEPSPKWLEARDALLREREEEWRLQEERERRAGWGGTGITPGMERNSSWDGHSGTLVAESSASWPPRGDGLERHYLTTSTGVASVPISGRRSPVQVDRAGRHPDQYADYLHDNTAHSDSGMSMRTLRSPRNNRYDDHNSDDGGNEFADAYEGSSHGDEDANPDEQEGRVRGRVSNENEDRRGEGGLLMRSEQGWGKDKRKAGSGGTPHRNAENQKLLERVGGVEDEWRDWE